VAAVAQRWEAACRAGDPAGIVALLSDDAKVWFNYQGIDLDRAAYRKLLEESSKSFSKRAYRDFRVLRHPGGFVEQATLEGELAGRPVSAPFCLFATVVDGKITRLDEYFDSATLQPKDSAAL
jgi:ketosteroid isomerase-like protein